MESLKAPRPARFGLRAKLALVTLVLLALPWAGILYVNEMERLLLHGQEQALLGTARAVATALHERPLMVVASAAPGEGDVAAILAGLRRSASRIWVVNREFTVLARTGTLERQGGAELPSAWWESALAWLVQRPTENFVDVLGPDGIAGAQDVMAALQGTPATRTRRTQDGRAVVMSAAHPIWSGDEVMGAVVAEETTNAVASMRSTALERLLVVTLASFTGVAAFLIAYATRLSLRIRRLRDEAESAIDGRGRITQLGSGSRAGDEIGDLSRSFSAVLDRLAQHHAYLESMAGRLSHELRTPVAVVRSSLENVKLASSPEEVRRYIERAEEGLQRMNRILDRMTEASRLEQSLSVVEPERYDLEPVVRGCVEGYRVAYPQAQFRLELPGRRAEVRGAPDLAAQLLDKLVENAVDFCSPGQPIDIRLENRTGESLLTVANKGPALPSEMRGRLFQSMISVREQRNAGAPHLGLGLYVARLIAEFHGGNIVAVNLPSGDGVAVTVRMPAPWH